LLALALSVKYRPFAEGCQGNNSSLALAPVAPLTDERRRPCRQVADEHVRSGRLTGVGIPGPLGPVG
jgi:hypothetical protein